MSIDVIGVAGSPRAVSNSQTLLAEVLDVAKQKGLSTQEVRLNRLSYKGCQACNGCAQTGRCVVRDDVQEVHGKLIAARVWVFAGPVYFDGLCGQFKLFFDRFYCFTHAGHKLPGIRRGAVILTYEDKRNPFYEEVARRTANYFTWFGTFEMVETLPVSLVGAGDAARSRPDALAQARELGQKLVGDLAPAGPDAVAS